MKEGKVTKEWKEGGKTKEVGGGKAKTNRERERER